MTTSQPPRSASRRRRVPRVAIASATAALAVAALAACSSSGGGSTGSGASGSASGAPSSITYGEIGTPGEVPAVDFGTHAYFPAIEKKYGVKISVKYFTSPTSGYAALLAGQIQVLDASPATLMLTIAKGQGKDLVALASTAQGGEGVFVAPTKNKSRGTGITAVKNYGTGSTWGVPSIGGVGQFFVNLALDSEGVDYSKVTEVSLGAGTVAALSSGRVDIATAGVTQAYPLVEQGKAYLVWFTSGQEAYQKFGYVPADAMVSTKSFTAKYPKFTQDLVAAELKSVQFFRTNENSPQTVYKALSPDAQKDITESQFVAIWPFIRAVSIPATGVLSQADMVSYATLLKKFNALPANFTPPAGMADTSFAAAAYKSLGQAVPTTPLDPKWTSVMNDQSIVLH